MGGAGVEAPMSPACLSCCMTDMGSDAGGGAAGTAGAGGGVGTAGVGVVFLDGLACCASKVARAPLPSSESIDTGVDGAGTVGVGTGGVALEDGAR